MKVRVLDASVEFLDQPFLKPLQLSSGLITQATEARVAVTVRVDGREGTGRGSIYLSDLWAWPGMSPDRAEKDRVLRALCTTLAGSLAAACGGEDEHPLELGLRLHHTISVPAYAPGIPLLARAVCGSPFDAAIHDAAGQVLGRSAFEFYGKSVAIPSADKWFPGKGAVAAIRETLREPVRELDAWWIVGAGDDLEGAVGPAVRERGMRCFKIKALGRDNDADAARVAEISRAARGWGISPPRAANARTAPDLTDRARMLRGLTSVRATGMKTPAAPMVRHRRTTGSNALNPAHAEIRPAGRMVLPRRGTASASLSMVPALKIAAPALAATSPPLSAGGSPTGWRRWLVN
ncbi:MAG TPA: hypothetical protein PLS03_03385 [Terrimicrobiaceae bacterium]|nr:hypothetical protein [Terrimicrobiaceae bacterium]